MLQNYREMSSRDESDKYLSDYLTTAQIIKDKGWGKEAQGWSGFSLLV